MVGRFSSLFQGRTDFLGAEDGGCIRVYTHDGDRHMPWIYQGHLTGTRPPIGIYPVVTGSRPIAGGGEIKSYEVKFGAIDIDFEDLPLALNLHKALQALGLQAHIERSRSKGYHVWIFTEEWVPAVLMRSALQVACDIVHYNPKEIFPKQTELADGSPGNYIRLPYPGALLKSDPPLRRVMLAPDSTDSLALADWLDIAWESRCSRAGLEQAASLAAKPKPRTVLKRETEQTPEVASLVPKMGGLAFTIWENGPLPEADRSGTLFKLAYALRDSGMDSQDAFVLLKDADERWGKFSDRADGEDRLWEIIERVY